MGMQRSVNGAIAGGAAAAVWAAQQPLDKRVFGSRYDDVELLGKLVTRGEGWQMTGLALHIQNGALLGALYAQAKPFLPGPAIARALIVGMSEHLSTWPMGRFVDRYHPARDELPRLSGNRRAFAQVAWRHFVFSVVMSEVERRLNAERPGEEPGEVPVASNGHGNLELAVGTT